MVPVQLHHKLPHLYRVYRGGMFCGTMGVFSLFMKWRGQHAINCEYFNVSDSMACAKIKRTKYMRNINDNVVQGRLSEKYLMRKIIA